MSYDQKLIRTAAQFKKEFERLFPRKIDKNRLTQIRQKITKRRGMLMGGIIGDFRGLEYIRCYSFVFLLVLFEVFIYF